MRERAASGDNTPWADSLEELHDDMAKNEYLATREVLASRLRAFTRAEEKLREGTYGLCDSCEAEIAPARLRAVPEAVHCVRCAEKAEQRRAIRQERLWAAEAHLAAA
jgi:RNA polymerase-binding transcription factor DksA